MSSLLSKFINIQNTMQRIEKDKKNHHFRNEYASLGEILSKLRPELEIHGMGFSQTVNYKEAGYYECSTMFFDNEMDENEPFLEFKNSFAVNVNDMQKFGSLVTYAKRYSLTGCLGIDADEDDDAAIASYTEKQSELIKKSIDKGVKIDDTLLSRVKRMTDKQIEEALSKLDNFKGNANESKSK